jgi:hypothetical protein
MQSKIETILHSDQSYNTRFIKQFTYSNLKIIYTFNYYYTISLAKIFIDCIPTWCPDIKAPWLDLEGQKSERISTPSSWEFIKDESRYIWFNLVLSNIIFELFTTKTKRFSNLWSNTHPCTNNIFTVQMIAIYTTLFYPSLLFTVLPKL